MITHDFCVLFERLKMGVFDLPIIDKQEFIGTAGILKSYSGLTAKVV